MTDAAKQKREQKILMFILLALALIGTAVMVYGVAVDSDALPILGFVIAMPMFFAFLINLGVFLMWSDKPGG